eukprot:scaffold6966_cov112-Cylindrotheca_fusiformis.AAC.27
MNNENDVSLRQGNRSINGRRDSSSNYGNGNSSTPSSGRQPSPLLHAKTVPLFQKLLFGWAWPLLKLGSTRPLEEMDLPEVHPLDSSVYNKEYISQLWQRQRNQCKNNIGNGTHSEVVGDVDVDNENVNEHVSHDDGDGGDLGRALFRDYFQTTRFPQLILALNSASRIGQAIALGFLMEQFTQPQGGGGGSDEQKKNTKKGYLWCAILVGCGLIGFPTKQRLYFELYRKGMQLRVGLVATIYNKALRLSSTTTSSTNSNSDNSTQNTISAGKLTNLASNDVERFLSASIPTLFLFIGPIEAIVILIVGIFTIGPVFLVGHGLFLLLIPLQVFLGRRFVYYRSRVAAITDARVTLMSQAVSGARIVKLNGWELELQQRIATLRSKEVALLRAASRYKALNDALYYFSSMVVAVAIFSVRVLLGKDLSPRNVYTTLTLLNILQLSITKQIPNAVMTLSECLVSSKRIQAFLELPENTNSEKDGTNVNNTSSSGGGDEKERVVLSVSAMTCVWDAEVQHQHQDPSSSNSMVVALSNVSLSFECGRLYGIVGKVGCGKSALLQALAGELHVTQGTIFRKYSSLAYAEQNPWIMNGSIRENIIMGRQSSSSSSPKEWYETVLEACGLTFDLSSMANGDETIVGDRGIQLSGGQRARIGLARACYGDSQVLLLDDPLSAVDSSLATSIFQKAILELGVEKGKCIIMATHQKQFLRQQDCLIVVDQGKVISAGEIGVDDTGHISTEMDQTRDTVVAPEEETAPTTSTTNNDETTKTSLAEHNEKRSTGIVEWPTWAAYGKAGGGLHVGLVFFLAFVITQSCLLVLIVKVGSWAEAPHDEQDKPYWFGVVLGLSAGLVILSIARAQFTYHHLIGISQRLHNGMLRSVLRSKIEFFDMNPLGRILNRFSADVGITDEILPLTIYDFLVGAFIVAGGVVTASIGLPFVLVAIPPLVWYFIRLRKIFVSTTRELKRLEGIARSPIFAMMSESLQGMSTIRANNFTEHFRNKFETLHDAHTRAFFAFVASSRWFATRMDILSFTLLATGSILAVLFNDQGWYEVDPAVLGLALTLLIQIAGTNFPWIVRQSAEIVNQMVSVERVLEFGNLTPEAALQTDIDFPPPDLNDDDDGASKRQSIVATDFSVRYRPALPLALRKVSFDIPLGSRIGVVGRTGSGKSTFVQSLFRLLEADSGSIQIGGVDISQMGLHSLRNAISIIPQDPTLFSGLSVRENLDIFGIYSEQDIQRALRTAHMEETIRSLPNGYDSFVAEGGSNFSVGQRQLLCLARASLKRNRILVLDEATASVDQDTERLLQESLKDERSYYYSKNNSNFTIITIAHRLETIIEDDYILVLGSGQLIELDSPANLLRRRSDGSGTFSKMVEDTGISSKLKKRAFAAELAKQKKNE